MKQFWVRLKSDVPVFFRTIQAIGGSVSAAAVAISQLKGTSPTLQSHCETAIWVGGVAAIVAQFAVKGHVNEVIAKETETK